MLDTVTPLSKDCGMLCDGACCKDGENERKGMLLFPGEEKLLSGKGYDIRPSSWKYADKNAFILYCDGTCNRHYRPLGCRLFPLTPVVKDDGKIKTVMNPLAKSICPLARSLKPAQLEEEFVNNVQRALNRVWHLKDGKAFIKMLSAVTKDYERIIK